MNKKVTKRALFLSFVSMFLCFTMLIGTTYAWFTDSVSSGMNTIVAGNLDVELYNGLDNTAAKIGTTTRAVLKRLKEELQSKTYKEMGCVRAVINRVYDCGNLPAEGLESYFRATYIKRYPDSFKKNDRFISTFFDLTEADKIAEKYLA